jgi:hypothetical protein
VIDLRQLRQIAEPNLKGGTVQSRAAYAETFGPAVVLELIQALDLAVDLLDQTGLSHDPHAIDPTGRLTITIPDEETIQEWLTTRKGIHL